MNYVMNYFMVKFQQLVPVLFGSLVALHLIRCQ
jgi:hypothetical protein